MEVYGIAIICKYRLPESALLISQADYMNIFSGYSHSSNPLYKDNLLEPHTKNVLETTLILFSNILTQPLPLSLRVCGFI